MLLPCVMWDVCNVSHTLMPAFPRPASAGPNLVSCVPHVAMSRLEEFSTGPPRTKYVSFANYPSKNIEIIRVVQKDF